jgi:carbonic anhydrase/acetyltransferase-like protein (isoleucine patch superfamily)
MKNIIIIGAGAHSAEIAGLIYDNNKHVSEADKIRIKGYLDDHNENWHRYKFKEPLLSNLTEYIPEADDLFLLGVSNVESRRICLEKIKHKKINYANFIHYTAIVYETAKIGVGNVICCFSKLGPNSIVGNLNSINSKTEIGHDCVIGSNNVFSGNVGIAGYCSVGDENFFGMNSSVIPDKRIGSRNIIQAVIVVDKNIEDDSYFFHRFKEKVLAIPKK